jgi:filamentous hemagglutinin
VKGSTKLVGGLIDSRETAIDANRNQLKTGTLITSDLLNTANGTASSSGTTVSSDALNQGSYGIAKTIIGNLLNSGSASGTSVGITRSAVAGGTVVITDDAGQIAATGKTAEESIAGLNRNTSLTNIPAQPQNLQNLQQQPALEAA